MKKCQARQVSDQMCCTQCGVVWDINDPEPPVCKNTKVNVKIIAAMNEDRVIGRDGGIPWHSPEDLKHFQQTTKHNVVIMGRKTFESLGNRPLKERINIVVSRKGHNTDAPNVQFYPCLDSALVAATKQANNHDCDVFIIGGGEIYKQCMRKADEIILSVFRFNGIQEGDVIFPELLDKWKATRSVPFNDAPEPFDVLYLERK